MPRLLSLRELSPIYLYEKKSFIFANKDFLMNQASVQFLRAVNQPQWADAVPGVTALGKSLAGTDPGGKDHQGGIACVNDQGGEKT